MPTTDTQPAIVAKRYDFVLLFDVQDGNPNGDPDAGNLPRIDPQSLQGIVTDVCLKRKLRNAIATLGDGKPGMNSTSKPKTLSTKSESSICSTKGHMTLKNSRKMARMRKKRRPTPRLHGSGCAPTFSTSEPSEP